MVCMKHAPYRLVDLNTWSPVGGAVCRCFGSFQSCGLAGGSLAWVLRAFSFALLAVHSLCFGLWLKV